MSPYFVRPTLCQLHIQCQETQVADASIPASILLAMGVGCIDKSKHARIAAQPPIMHCLLLGILEDKLRRLFPWQLLHTDVPVVQMNWSIDSIDECASVPFIICAL